MKRQKARRASDPPKLELVPPEREALSRRYRPLSLSEVLDQVKERAFMQAVIGSDGDIADDIADRVQVEVWEAIQKDPRLLTEPTEIESMVFHITGNRVKDWYRRQHVAKARQAEIAEYLKNGTPTWADPDATLSEKLLRSRIAQVVAKFPAQMKVIWYMWFVELLAPRTIADQLEVVVKTVNAQLARAKDRIKKALIHDGYGFFFWRRKS